MQIKSMISPANSPDLNPIEHFFVEIKKKTTTKKTKNKKKKQKQKKQKKNKTGRWESSINRRFIVCH